MAELVQNLDIAPTLLDMVGVERPAGWSGRSLAWALAGKPSPAAAGKASPPPAFSEGAWTFWIGSVLSGERKFILVTPQDRMLFDLASDPGEKKNLAMEDSGRDSVRTLYHVLMKHLGGQAGQVAAGARAVLRDLDEAGHGPLRPHRGERSGEGAPRPRLPEVAGSGLNSSELDPDVGPGRRRAETPKILGLTPS